MWRWLATAGGLGVLGAVEQADCNEEHHDLQARERERERERERDTPTVSGMARTGHPKVSALLTSTRTRTTPSVATTRRLFSTNSKTAVSQVCRETCAVVGVSLRTGASSWKWYISTSHNSLCNIMACRNNCQKQCGRCRH